MAARWTRRSAIESIYRGYESVLWSGRLLVSICHSERRSPRRPESKDPIPEWTIARDRASGDRRLVFHAGEFLFLHRNVQAHHAREVLAFAFQLGHCRLEVA